MRLEDGTLLLLSNVSVFCCAVANVLFELANNKIAIKFAVYTRTSVPSHLGAMQTDNKHPHTHFIYLHCMRLSINAFGKYRNAVRAVQLAVDRPHTLWTVRKSLFIATQTKHELHRVCAPVAYWETSKCFFVVIGSFCVCGATVAICCLLLFEFASDSCVGMWFCHLCDVFFRIRCVGFPCVLLHWRSSLFRFPRFNCGLSPGSFFRPRSPMCQLFF